MKLGTYLSENNISQPDFAKRIGVAQAAVSRYVRGDRVPRSKHLVQIAKATKNAVTANDFMPAAEKQARA